MAEKEAPVAKRPRVLSFSSEEKLLIANICKKYGHIIENEKTDNVTCREKDTAWEKIARDVNSVNNVYRSADVLKRFYDNRKREVRKIAADEKKEIYGTGGGPPGVIKKDPCHDIILSIINLKTVYGLENLFDGDAGTSTEPESNKNTEVKSVETDTIVYELSNEEEQTWKNYKPADLKKPISKSLLPHFEDTVQKVDTENDAKESGTPIMQRRKTALSSSRRRPTVQVKSLTRSDLAERYDQLLDKRLVIADFQKKKLQEELLTIEGERKLKFQLLEIQIEVEKEKLKKLKS